MGKSSAWRAAAHTVAAAAVLLWCLCPAFSGDVMITVTDDLGRPIGGARVMLWGERGAPRLRPGDAKTDAEGKLTLSDLAPGAYNLDVFAQGHASDHRDITVQADAPLRLDVSLPRGCRVSGRVTLAAGEPLANADVMVRFVRPLHSSGRGTRTGPDGTYTVVCREPGLHDVVLKAPGYAKVERGDVELTVGGEVTDVNFVLDAPAGSIAGVVYEPDGQTPKADAVVWLEAARHLQWLDRGRFSDFAIVREDAFDRDRHFGPTRPRTGRNGSFVVSDLAAGTYILYAYVRGYTRATAEEAVVAGRSENVTGVKIVLKAGASVSGIVYGTNGQPLANARLEVRIRARRDNSSYSTNVTITTDEHGRYWLGSLPAAHYELEIELDDEARSVRQVELGEAEAVTEFDFRHTDGHTLTVLIVAPDGQPVTDAQARLWKQTSAGGYSSRRSRQTAAPDGRVHFDGLLDGTYWVVVTSPAAAAERLGPVTVQTGEPVPELRLPLKQGATINGRVVDERASPIPGAKVESRCYKATPGPRMSSETRTTLTSDAEGRFVVPHAAPGRWSFDAKAPRHVAASARVEVGDEGEYEANIVMPRAWSGTLEGRILVPDGQTPVANTPFSVALLTRREGRERTVRTESITTDADGLFSVSVRTGIQGAKFIAEGLTPTTVEIQPSERETVSLSVRLSPPSGMRGVVELAGATIPPEGLYVLAVPPGRTAVLPDERPQAPKADQGLAKVMPGQTEWQIVGLEPGDYEVFTYAPGLAPSVAWPVTIAEGEMAEAVVDIALPGAIAGRLLTAQGEPLEGISVRAKTSGGHVLGVSSYVKTDAEGRYRLEGLTPGFVTVAVSPRSHGYATPPEQATLVVPGETIDNVDFELFVGGEVRGVVKRRDGKPLTRQYRVELDMGPVPHRKVYVAADGTFKFERVHPGSYDLYLEPRDLTDFELIAKREGITVAEGQTLQGIEFVLEE